MTTSQEESGQPGKVVAVILAGGRARRMGGRDKATVRVGGERLIDRVLARLRPQAGRILLSARNDYGTGLTTVADAPGTPKGPAGGIYSLHEWIRLHDPSVLGFVTAPVDCPFLPGDLVERLAGGARAAVASDGQNDHPTLAWWPCEALSAAWPHLAGKTSVSLKRLAGLCSARRVIWSNTDVFLNVNSPEDLRAAETVAADGLPG